MSGRRWELGCGVALLWLKNCDKLTRNNKKTDKERGPGWLAGSRATRRHTRSKIKIQLLSQTNENKNIWSLIARRTCCLGSWLLNVWLNVFIQDLTLKEVNPTAQPSPRLIFERSHVSAFRKAVNTKSSITNRHRIVSRDKTRSNWYYLSLS